MTPTPADQRWHQTVLREARRIARAQRERGGVLGHSIYAGTLGLVFVLPVIVGAYLGLWIDEQLPGYSVRGTLSGIVIGLAIGFADVYLLLRERD